MCLVCPKNDHWKHVHDSIGANFDHNGQYLPRFEHIYDNFHSNDLNHYVHSIQFSIKLCGRLIRTWFWHVRRYDPSYYRCMDLMFLRKWRHRSNLACFCLGTWRVFLDFHFEHSLKSIDNLVSFLRKGEGNCNDDSLCSFRCDDWICNAYTVCKRLA